MRFFLDKLIIDLMFARYIHFMLLFYSQMQTIVYLTLVFLTSQESVTEIVMKLEHIVLEIYPGVVNR